MFDFLALIIVLVCCGVIVLVLSKMTKHGSFVHKEKYHYRCSNNFRHTFSIYEISQSYDLNKKIICPITNCGGELILYETLESEKNNAAED
ncbi:MAG TPA: hypothetical protein PLD27_08075 [bacterium]|mgnify:FL=1|nr:hypothetical protein [bacterium]HOL48079.1 hypothetical protein [bacterium]HPQ19161.1 hypothetical protein [bacterium]